MVKNYACATVFLFYSSRLYILSFILLFGKGNNKLSIFFWHLSGVCILKLLRSGASPQISDPQIPNDLMIAEASLTEDPCACGRTFDCIPKLTKRAPVVIKLCTQCILTSIAKHRFYAADKRSSILCIHTRL
jgi:hypothetical protein